MAGGTTSQQAGRVGPAEQVAALSGLASVVLLLVGDAIGDVSGDGIDPSWPSRELVQALQQHAGTMGIGAALVALAAVLAVVFLGTLWDRFRRGSEGLAVVAVAGGLLFAIQILGLAAQDIGLAGVEGVQDATTARALMAADHSGARLLAVPPLVLAGASLVAAIRYGLFPRWFRWFNVALMVVLALSLFPIGPTGLMAVLGISWFFVASLSFAAEDTEDLPGTEGAAR